MWSRDGDIYFVERPGRQRSDQLSGAPPEAGGKADKVTSFRSGDVRFPSISADGKTIVFEHDFGIWKLDTASKKVTPIKLDIDAETEENDQEMRAFSSEADDYDLAPSARA
jgi:tricorn protease